MKSKALKWYQRHNNAIDVVVDIACDAIPGAGVVKGVFKGLRDDSSENTNTSEKAELEALLHLIKPILADLVEDIEDLKAFKEATSTEKISIIVKNSELKKELDEVMPQLSESITKSIKNLSSKKLSKKIINGRYLLEKTIGKGGQGEVHKALHLQADSQIAIKLLPPELSNDLMAIKSLRSEYQRLTNNLCHPNIVQYRDLNQDQESGQWFIVMDYIDGNNLRYHLLERKHRPFSLEETLDILIPIAKALSFSHEKNVIHCDLKPENIIIKKNSEVFLTDFGLAHEVQSSLSTKGTTTTDICGTLPYMSPEQYMGKRMRKATDIWALGVIFYEMVEGYHPFNGKSFDHYKMLICEQQPEQPENLSLGQWQALSQMLQKDHLERPVGATEAINKIFYLKAQEAIKKTEKMQKKNFSQSATKELATADDYDHLGISYYKKKMYDKAIANHNKAIELNPKLVSAYNNRGNSYAKKEMYDKAIADYTKAIELNPQYVIAYDNRASSYIKKEMYDKAIVDYTKAIELNPLLAIAYNNRGLCYKNKGMHDKAIVDYTKAIELNPQYILAYDNRGVSYADKGMYSEAIADYNKAIELNPQYAVTYYNLACAFSLQKDQKALQYFEKALQLGYQEFSCIEQDTELDFIKNMPQYQALIKKYKKYIMLPFFERKNAVRVKK